jgi:hypothetical protein
MLLSALAVRRNLLHSSYRCDAVPAIILMLKMNDAPSLLILPNLESRHGDRNSRSIAFASLMPLKLSVSDWQGLVFIQHLGCKDIWEMLLLISRLPSIGKPKKRINDT